MKKYFILVFVLIAVLTLASCGGEEKPIGGDSYDTAYPDDAGSLKIGVKEEDGKVVEVGVDEDKELSSYVIVCADETLMAAAEILQKGIEARTEIKPEIKCEDSSERQMILLLDSEKAITDYSITADGRKIYIKAGSAEALSSASSVFAKFFIYTSNKSVFVPAGRGYKYELTYFIDKLTVDGIDIKEFSLYSDEGNASIEAENKFDVFAAALNEKLSTLMGITLPIAGEKADGGHYIVVSASASLVNPYSIKIENGDLYFTGSFLSVDAALDAFVGDLLGYTEGTEEHSKTLELTASDNKDGSLGLTVPYTKDELMTLLYDTYEDDSKIISGTHTYAYGEVFSATRAGSATIAQTSEGFASKDSQTAALIEIDVGRYGPYRKENNGEELFRAYDLSKMVSEAMEHVSNGGIICICAHLGNPFMNSSQGKWYHGVLPGGDADVKAMITEGTDLNEMYRITTDSTHRLIKAFADNGIPFLYRPFHEMNGDWFWWGLKAGGGISAEAFCSLWRYEYGIVTDELGADSVWVYSPGVGSEVLIGYPGDEYVDITGVDWYTRGNREYNSGDGYTMLMSLEKPVAVTETGANGLEKKDIDGNLYIDPDDYNCGRLLEDLKSMIDSGLNVTYFSTWSNWLSVLDMEGTKEFMADELIVSREELLEYWNNN